MIFKAILILSFLFLFAEAKKPRRYRGRGRQSETRPQLESRAREFLDLYLEKAARKHGHSFHKAAGRRQRLSTQDDTEAGPNSDILGDLFEVDVLLTPSQAEEIYSTGEVQRAVTTGSFGLWPQTVYYSIGFDTSDGTRVAAIESGLDQWRESTCLRFVQSTSQSNRLNFIIGGGCYSYIGQIGGAQSVSIGYGCEYSGIVAHEVGHALGFWHEQSRPDRDNHVRINFDNIISGTEGNFQKVSAGTTNDRGVAYDLGSIMHYGFTGFSLNGMNTIDSVDPSFTNTYGQRGSISYADVKQMNLLYCADECSSALACENDGYTDPKDCSRCRCPPGFSGRLCDQVEAAPCGGEIQATPDWQEIQSSGSNCIFLLKAPAGGQVELVFTSMRYDNRKTCGSNYVEVKYKNEFDTTGARLCSSTLWTLTSYKDQIVLIHKGSSGFAAKFRSRGGVVVTTQRPPATTTRPPVTTTRPPVTTRPPLTTRPTTTTSPRTTRRPRRCRCRQWAAWSPWSECSGTCGGCGTRSRTRECLTCEKTRTRFASCGRESRVPCPVGSYPTSAPGSEDGKGDGEEEENKPTTQVRGRRVGRFGRRGSVGREEETGDSEDTASRPTRSGRGRGSSLLSKYRGNERRGKRAADITLHPHGGDGECCPGYRLNRRGTRCSKSRRRGRRG